MLYIKSCTNFLLRCISESVRHTRDIITIQTAGFTQLDNVRSLHECVRDLSDTDAVARGTLNTPDYHRSISLIQ
jgi:hypothetical protein